MTFDEPSSRSLLERFDSDGYLALPGFLKASEVEILARQIDRFIRDVVPKMPAEKVYFEVKSRPETLKQFELMVEHDAWFHDFFSASEFSRLAELLLKGPVIGKNLQWFNKPPLLGKATPPHQDGYYFMIEPNEAITMWLALDVVDEQNGRIHYVPGSHRRGVRSHVRTGVLGFSQGINDYGLSDEAIEVAFDAKPGDLLVHHSLTIHRAGANQSERTRKALGFNYYSAAAREDVNRKLEYQEKLAADLTQEGKI